MAEKEGYAEDVVALHLGGATPPSTDNKFPISLDNPGSPGIQTKFDASPSFGENDFPRQTGHDSLSDDEALLA